ncbi:MAG: TRAP transporter small permease [Phyllobacterium sp.]
MSEADAKNGVRDLPGRILRLAALAAGLVLFGLMVLVSVAVFFRYMLNRPLMGADEIIQLGMIFVVMLAMPHTAMTDQNIRVDILDSFLGRRGRAFCDAFGRILGILVLSVLVSKSWDKMLDAREYREVTNMIELPLWTAHAAIGIGVALFILVMALQQYQAMTGGQDE